MPAWHSGLTVKQSADLERVQRVALYIILIDVDTGKSEYNYDMSMVILDIKPLYNRREQLCVNFARKTLKSSHSDMFQETISIYNTRQQKDAF